MANIEYSIHTASSKTIDSINHGLAVTETEHEFENKSKLTTYAVNRFYQNEAEQREPTPESNLNDENRTNRAEPTNTKEAFQFTLTGLHNSLFNREQIPSASANPWRKYLPWKKRKQRSIYWRPTICSSQSTPFAVASPINDSTEKLERIFTAEVVFAMAEEIVEGDNNEIKHYICTSDSNELQQATDEQYRLINASKPNLATFTSYVDVSNDSSILIDDNTNCYHQQDWEEHQEVKVSTLESGAVQQVPIAQVIPFEKIQAQYQSNLEEHVASAITAETTKAQNATSSIAKIKSNYRERTQEIRQKIALAANSSNSLDAGFNSDTTAGAHPVLELEEVDTTDQESTAQQLQQQLTQLETDHIKEITTLTQTKENATSRKAELEADRDKLKKLVPLMTISALFGHACEQKNTLSVKNVDLWNLLHIKGLQFSLPKGLWYKTSSTIGRSSSKNIWHGLLKKSQAGIKNLGNKIGIGTKRWLPSSLSNPSPRLFAPNLKNYFKNNVKIAKGPYWHSSTSSKPFFDLNEIYLRTGKKILITNIISLMSIGSIGYGCYYYHVAALAMSEIIGACAGIAGVICIAAAIIGYKHIQKCSVNLGPKQIEFSTSTPLTSSPITAESLAPTAQQQPNNTGNPAAEQPNPPQSAEDYLNYLSSEESDEQQDSSDESDEQQRSNVVVTVTKAEIDQLSNSGSESDFEVSV